MGYISPCVTTGLELPMCRLHQIIPGGGINKNSRILKHNEEIENDDLKQNIKAQVNEMLTFLIVQDKKP